MTDSDGGNIEEFTWHKVRRLIQDINPDCSEEEAGRIADDFLADIDKRVAEAINEVFPKTDK